MKKLTAENLKNIFGVKLSKEVSRWVNEVGLYKGIFLDESFIENVLERINNLIGGFGVENIINPDEDDVRLYFVNMGDPYSDTVMYDGTKGKFVIGDWGTWVEEMESIYGLFN